MSAPDTTEADRPPWDQKSVVNSVFKALALLECFTRETPELTIAELAERAGLNKATCSRLVTTMAHAGWLTRTQDRRFAPTFKALEVGAVALGRLDVREEARPLLRDLAGRFGDTAHLMVPDGTRAVCLEKIDGDHPVRVVAVDVGTSIPLHMAAAPLALLAHRPDLRAELDLDSLEAFTAQTTAAAELDDRLEEIRRLGYARSVGDYADGVAAIGAPVYDSDGVAVAAVSLGGVADRFRPPRREQIAEAVVAVARELSTRLGYRDTSRVSA